MNSACMQPPIARGRRAGAQRTQANGGRGYTTAPTTAWSGETCADAQVRNRSIAADLGEVPSALVRKGDRGTDLVMAAVWPARHSTFERQ